MQTSEVDFSLPIFPESPEGWKSANDLADGFLLAWALEVRERRRVEPGNPFGNHVLSLLPPPFRYDTLGPLVRMDQTAYRTAAGLSAGAKDATMPARRTTLCIVWRLFDELNSQWQLRPRDYGQLADATAFVTAGPEPRSLFRDDVDAIMAKCLLADRVRREHDANEILSQGEEWFAKGDRTLLIEGRGIPFVIAGNPIPIPVADHSFVRSVWAAARVLVEMNSPEHYILTLSHQLSSVLDLLERGAVWVEERATLPPIQARGFDPWPG